MKILLREWQDYNNKEDTLRHNEKIIFDFSKKINHEQMIGPEVINNLQNIPAFSQIKIDKPIGAGGYGEVFSLINSNKILKIFYLGDMYLHNGKSDIERIEIIEKQLFSGDASLEDMHYFDSGHIYDNVYYAIMPKIIPFEKSPYYQLSDVVAAIPQAITDAAFSDNLDMDSYQKFKRQVMLYLMNNIGPIKRLKKKGLLKDFLLYKSLIDDLIKAGYRAYILFGGVDLHAGNLGYLPQKPGLFFYYDM